jgi:hypothetical protein
MQNQTSFAWLNWVNEGGMGREGGGEGGAAAGGGGQVQEGAGATTKPLSNHAENCCPPGTFAQLIGNEVAS